MVLHSTLDQIHTAASSLLSYAKAHNVWILRGEMGAGKTTLVKALCYELGVLDTVNSPTFSIVHVYTLPNGDPVYHFDFYRIQHEQEAWALDCEEYFRSPHYCFVEWPQKITRMLPVKYLDIHITTPTRKQCRRIHVTPHG